MTRDQTVEIFYLDGVTPVPPEAIVGQVRAVRTRPPRNCTHGRCTRGVGGASPPTDFAPASIC